MKTNTLSVAFLALIGASVSLQAADINQVASGGNWQSGSTWDGGAVPTTGNDYFTNGVAELTARSVNFPGDSLTVQGGSTLVLRDSGLGIVNLTLQNGAIRSRGLSTTTFDVTNLTVADTFSSAIYGQSAGHVVTLDVTNLLGGGNFALGLDTKPSADYNFGVTTGTAFTGNLDFFFGDVTLTSDLGINNAALSMEGADVTLNLGGFSIVASSFDFGGTSVAVGDYTSTELNTLLSTSAFTGGGTLSVIPEASTTASILGLSALLLCMVRRRR